VAETISLDHLLASRLLDVPDYQRGYAWGTQQLSEFWEDLELIDPGGRHYTGTLVLKDRKETHFDEVRSVPLSAFDIVDGQQRMTTCIMLLDRLFGHLEGYGDPDTPTNRRRLLTATISGVQRPKLQLGADIRDYWEQVILRSKPWVDGAPLAAQRRLSMATEFFEARIAEQATNGSGPEHATWLRSLVGKVTGSLQFTLYVAEDDAEVGVIFETLNQRGKPLTELEKTKNYLLFLVSRLPEGQRRDLSEVINSAWKEIFTNLGRLPSDHEDQFLRAHWLATQNPSQREWSRVNSIKERFHRRKYVEAKQQLYDDVHGYANSLRQASAAYRDIVRDSSQGFAAYGDLTSHVRSASRDLRQAGVVQIFAPLLIAGRLRYPENAEPYLALVKQCERYSVRVFLIMERRANAGQARLYSLAHELHENGDANAASAGLAERISYFASDGELLADLLNVRRNWYAKPGHKYFLYQYELSLLGGNQPQLPFEHFTTGEYKSTSTEHILPQVPTDSCWLNVFSEEARSYLTHALGNLVLTFDNSAYGNFCFERKRDGVSVNGQVSASYRTSVLKEEQDLGHEETWTPMAIKQRQGRLAEWAMSRWAVPDAPAGPGIAPDDGDEDDGALPNDDTLMLQQSPTVESSSSVDR
jgi:hypothetical protein